MIPATNVKHLMLRDDVIEAVRAGDFHIYPVEHIDQGIEILTGLKAGERGDGDAYPEGSVNDLVQRRVNDLAQKTKDFSGKET
jgi:predicted ATP-dependent protease